jgi:hypothetical protein
MRPGSGILEAVERRCVRSAAGVHHDLAEQLNDLASVASTAFFFGVIGNVFGILYSFRGVVGEKSALMAALAQSLSESLWPTAFSLLVALMALGFYRYLSHRLSICDDEMEGATVDLLYHLRHYRQNLVRSDPQISADVVQHDDRSDCRWMPVAFPALILAFCLEILHFFDEGVDWGWVVWAASIHVLLTFSLSCIPAQFLWMKVFHRRRGTLIILASIFCFCWCLSEILFGVRAF